MTGADYIATVRLSDKDGRTLALPGERCAKVPASSLPWLLEQGLIEGGPARLASGEIVLNARQQAAIAATLTTQESDDE